MSWGAKAAPRVQACATVYLSLQVAVARYLVGPAADLGLLQGYPFCTSSKGGQAVSAQRSGQHITLYLAVAAIPTWPNLDSLYCNRQAHSLQICPGAFCRCAGAAHPAGPGS